MESRALAQKVQLSNDVSPPNSTAPTIDALRVRRSPNGIRQQSASDVRGLKLCSRRALSAPPVFNPRSRVSALLIVARGRGTKCIVLTVADTERARPREAGTENGQPFSICAVSRRTSGQISATGMPMTRNRANRKTAEDQRAGDPLPLPLSDCVANNSKWALSCFTSRSKPPSILPAQISVFQNRNGDV